jgi:hypothetical protein
MRARCDWSPQQGRPAALLFVVAVAPLCSVLPVRWLRAGTLHARRNGARRGPFVQERDLGA